MRIPSAPLLALVLLLLLAPRARAAVELVPQVTGTPFPQIALSRDGRLLAYAFQEVALFDVESGLLLRNIQRGSGKEWAVWSVAFADEDRLVVVGTISGVIRVYAADTGALVHALSGHTRQVEALAASGKRLLSLGLDKKLYTWDLATGARVAALPAKEPTAIALSPDGKLAAVTSEGGIEIWDAGTARLVRRYPFTDGASALAFSPDGKTLAIGTTIPYAIRTLDLTTGNVGVPIAELGDRVRSVTFADGGRAVVAGPGTHGQIEVKRRVLAQPSAGDGTIDVGGGMPSGRIALSADGERCAVTLDTYGVVEVMTTRDGASVGTFGRPRDFVQALAFDAAGRRVLVRSREGAGWLDLESAHYDEAAKLEQFGAVVVGHDGKLGVFPAAGRSGVRFMESRDGRTFLGQRADDGALVVADVDRAAVRAVLERDGCTLPGVGQPTLSPEGDRALARCDDDTLRLWDAKTGKVLRRLPKRSTVYRFKLLPGGARAVLGDADGNLVVWDLIADRLVTRLAKTRGTPSLSVSPDGKLVGWSSSTSEEIVVSEIATGKRVAALRAYGEAPVFSSKGDMVAFVSGNVVNVTRLGGAPAASFMTSGGEWILWDDRGHFEASRAGGGLVSAVSGLRAARVDQLAPWRNRPDLLAAAFAPGPSPLLEHLRARHATRLRRLGLRDDEASFEDAPTVRIDGATWSSDVLTLRGDVQATRADLSSYHVHVNNVPVSSGAIGGRRHALDTRVKLLPGANRVELSARDAAGLESMRALRTIRVPGPPPAGALWFVGFGVSRYRNPRYSLRYPSKDVADLADVLRAAKGRFTEVHVATHLDDGATASAVRAAGDWLAAAAPEDTAILFVAGHGIHSDDAAADYYFATHEVDPRDLPRTAVRFDALEEVLARTPARRRLFLIDTCEAGEKDEGSTATGPPAAPGRGRSTRALVLEQRRPARPFAFARDRFLYNDLGRRSGAVVLSSSRGDESSWELDALENGVFTETVMEALTSRAADGDGDGAVSTRELLAHLSKAVPEKTGDRQHPTIDRDNPAVHIALPIVPEAAAIVTRRGPPEPPAPAAVAPTTAPPRASAPAQRGCACDVATGRGGVAGPGAVVVAIAVALGRHLARRERRRPGPRPSKAGRV